MRRFLIVAIPLLFSANLYAQTATPTLTPTITKTPTLTATPTLTPTATWCSSFPRGSLHPDDRYFDLQKLFNKVYDERKKAIRVMPLYYLNSDGSFVPLDIE